MKFDTKTIWIIIGVALVCGILGFAGGKGYLTTGDLAVTSQIKERPIYTQDMVCCKRGAVVPNPVYKYTTETRSSCVQKGIGGTTVVVDSSFCNPTTCDSDLATAKLLILKQATVISNQQVMASQYTNTISEQATLISTLTQNCK